MGRLQELRVVDPVLTEVALGYENAELISESLFPIVPVPTEAGKVPKFGKEAFRVYNSERSIRAKSNIISPEGRTTVDYTCDEHDLAYPIDYREEDEDIFDSQEYATVASEGGIMLRREKIAADLAQNLNTYPTGHKVTLSGTDQWSDYNNSDPLANVETGRNTVRAAIAKLPNVIVMGYSTFSVLKFHPKLLELIKYTQKGVVTMDLMAELFEVDRVVVGKAIWVNDAGTATDLWGDNAILAYVPGAGQRSRYAPSFGYTLRKTTWPQVDTFTAEGGKIMYVRSTDIFVPKVVGSDAGYIIKDTNA